jgi:hypothetical protein
MNNTPWDKTRLIWRYNSVQHRLNSINDKSITLVIILKLSNITQNNDTNSGLSSFGILTSKVLLIEVMREGDQVYFITY